MTNSTYLRKFIIFKADYLNISGISPKGHGKIEIKGNRGEISVNIENSEVEKDYMVSLLRDEDGQLLEYNLGRVITDHRGKGKANFSINLKDLESEGFLMEEINPILIRKDNNILLGGYIHKDTEILNKFIKDLNTVEKDKETTIEYDTMEEIDTITIEPDLDSGDFENSHEEEIIEYDTEEENIVEDTVENIVEDIAEDTVENIVEDVEYIPEAMGIENYGEIGYIRKLEHKNQMISYILNILRFFPQVEPFKYNIQGYRFWQIDDYGVESYQSFLPYFNYLISADYKYPYLGDSPTCINQIKKYRHYLFGLYEENEDTKYYIYGVPGEFTTIEHPFRGITGFNTWYEAIDSMGYWLLYIDSMTGEIIHPLNPMVPAY